MKFRVCPFVQVETGKVKESLYRRLKNQKEKTAGKHNYPAVFSFFGINYEKAR
jgi:hypothetical protein